MEQLAPIVVLPCVNNRAFLFSTVHTVLCCMYLCTEMSLLSPATTRCTPYSRNSSHSGEEWLFYFQGRGRMDTGWRSKHFLLHTFTAPYMYMYMYGAVVVRGTNRELQRHTSYTVHGISPFSVVVPWLLRVRAA